MQQIIRVVIEDGTPTIHVQGVKGKSCKDITKALEQALGDVAESTPTAEMYEKAKQTTKAGN